MNASNDMKILIDRVDKLEATLESITILSPWQIRVVTWTSNAVVGILTISGLYIVAANLLKAMDAVKGFLK